MRRVLVRRRRSEDDRPRWNGVEFEGEETSPAPRGGGPRDSVLWALAVVVDRRGPSRERMALAEFHLREALRLMDLLAERTT